MPPHERRPAGIPVIAERGYRRRQFAVLKEAQEALNVAFGAILSAYVGNSLAEIDNRPFDQVRLAEFFLLVALFIGGLCVGNALLLRREWWLGGGILLLGLAAAVVAHHEGRVLGFEVAILRIISLCWVAALLLSSTGLSLILYLHHRIRT